jgi:hypothetical protein
MNLVTHAQVIATFGPLDDVIVDAIIGMRPTLEELCEARAWIANDEASINSSKHLAHGRVAQLVEILSSLEEWPDQEDEVRS